MDPATILAVGSGIASLGTGIWNAIAGGSAEAKRQHNEELANAIKMKYGGISGKAPEPTPVQSRDVVTPSIMAGVGGALSALQGGLDRAERKSVWDRILPEKAAAEAVTPNPEVAAKAAAITSSFKMPEELTYKRNGMKPRLVGGPYPTKYSTWDLLDAGM